MFKSCYTNYTEGNINSFNVKSLSSERRRQYIVLEPQNFKNNSFAFKTMKEIESSKEINDMKIKHNVILQYDKVNKTYFLLVPTDIKINENLKRNKKCGINVGYRTFIALISENKCIEIGSNICNHIYKRNKRIDKLNSLKDTNKIKNRQYKSKTNKLRSKLANKIEDLHKKTANFLFKNFETINIGKLSTKSMVSNLTGNIKEITKRRLFALKHYKFRDYLKLNCKKYNTKVNEVSEYMTSKTCSSCKNIKKDLGANKVYNCDKCKLVIDRDINASINILKI